MTSPAPEVVLVYLTGQPRPGRGSPRRGHRPGAATVYKNGFVKNKVLEFVGPGIANLPMDYRIGIDVMTTETACLSSIWETDEAVEEYLAIHGRPEAYEALHPQDGAYYDSLITIDLSKVEPMAALPFHPSEAYTIRELMANPGDILRRGGEARPPSSSAARSPCSLTDKLRGRQDLWWTRASSPAAPAACTTTSPRPPPSWTATTWAAGTSPCPSIPPPCR